MKQITDKEADEEVDKFANQVYDKVIELIKINQKELERINKEEKGDFMDFNNGGIAFGDVIIHQINKQLKQPIKR